jgi:glycosyltransferase involved in cell wall biosynthesis
VLPIPTSASKLRPLRGRKRGSPDARKPTIAYLSYSTGEFDARTFRMAESAIDAGYRVRVYSRWHPGQLPREDRGDYELIRVPFDWRLGVPLLRKAARRRAFAAMAAAPTEAALAAAKMAEAAAAEAAAAEAEGTTGGAMSVSSPAPGGEADAIEERGAHAAAMAEDLARAERRARRSPLERRLRRLARPVVRAAKRFVRIARRIRRSPRLVLTIPIRVVARIRRPGGHLWRQLVMFPMGPRGWAVAMDAFAEPADIWHGMWAGSLPALVRMRKKHGGRAIYDSRDIFMESRDWARLYKPVRAVLQRLERGWSQRVDLVLTVNESYAKILEKLLGIPRPPVVMNCQPRWTLPDPPPDFIRDALGVGAEVGIALYQGRLQSDRGIEQSMEAILEVPNAVLALLGFGGWERRLAEQIATAPYAGKVYLLPAVPPDQLVAWTASADVSVMAIQPSSLNHRWTTPQKLFESLAAGTPVVASNLPGMAEIVKPAKAGVLVNPTAPHDIARGMRAILDAPPDERRALRERVREAAWDRYTWEAQVVTLLQLYRDLLGDDRATQLRPRLRRTAGPTLHLVDRAGDSVAGDVQIVLDPTWMPPSGAPDGDVRSALSIGEDVLRTRDIGRDAMELLDGWADKADIAARTTLHGTSFWYGLRLQYWSWVLDTSLWLAVLSRVLDEHPEIARLTCPADADEQLLEACELVTEARGLRFEPGPPGSRRKASQGNGRTPPSAPIGAPEDVLGRLRWRLRPPQIARRQRAQVDLVERLEHSPSRRLLVVEAHVPQRINSPSGPRMMNAYLGPIVDKLAGTALEPIELDLRADLANDAHWERLSSPGGARRLSGYVLGLGEIPDYSPGAARLEARGLAAAIANDRTPLEVDGVDMGPSLRRVVAQRVEGGLARRLREIAEIRALLRRLRPAGILLADEYHRQEWLAAAALESVPVAAVQHGVIHRTHVGYVHRSRPPELRLPERTYVFGAWERSLLLRDSVYRADEVVVGGSPRLDLIVPEPVGREEMRRELKVAPGHRLVVLSGSWGPLQRRFYYPIALRRLFDRELPGLHLVVKLHPTETDEGPYRAVIQGVAARSGFDPPPISVVQDVDLYDLLRAADAHLGVRSTVLTEAVVVGTPNLLAAGLAGYDQLDYVPSGVAIPVHDGGELLDALPFIDAGIDPALQAAFVAAHFDPEGGAQRIADDLLAWLVPARVASAA